MSRKLFFYGVIIVLILVGITLSAIFWNQRHSIPTIVSVATTTQTANQTSTTLIPAPPTHTLTNSYSINLPNSLMLVDSQGRRTGKDPITGTIYHEIPSTSYFEEGSSGQLYFFTPPSDQYTVYVLGGTTGQYDLNYWVDYGDSKPPKREVVSGNIQKGSMMAYVQNYDAAHIASSTFVASSTVSSTASITSVPPNNLPTPPVQ